MQANSIPYSDETGWNKNTVHRIVKNPAYCGKDRYPPIVEYTLFQKAQVLCQRKAPTYTESLKDIRGDIICPDCGSRLEWQTKGHRWRCRHCAAFSVRIEPDILLQSIATTMKRLQDNPNSIDSPPLSHNTVSIEAEKRQVEIDEMLSAGNFDAESLIQNVLARADAQYLSRGKRMGFRHGRFSFPYAQMLGYRKGADGQPEIIPEQAELIRMIYTSYLHGDSLQTIKSKVEAGGYKTVRGNTTWSTQALLRILQNEKYCGDVLLQKTFTDNVLTGGPKKNTGQLPQYYIENNHEGIVTKQMYREVQAEIARRNSKSCANQRKKKRGRYNSKYALSERLYCGECGSPYKRVTWNIHGRKEIVWRCVNRVTYGTKFCHNSPSVQEEVLHRTLLRAIQNLADNYTEEVSMQINGILHDLQGGTTELEKLQQKLADARQEFDRLLDISLECDASFLDEKLKHASEEIDTLQKQIDQLTASQQKAANPDLQLTDSDFRITEYSDTLVARIIERIDIVSANEIKIEFIGGYTVIAPLRS